MDLLELKKSIESVSGVLSSSIEKGELIVKLDKDRTVSFLELLKVKYEFQILIGICGVDYPHFAKRFQVIYQLLSITWNLRILVKIEFDSKESALSVVDLYSSAQWYGFIRY